MGSDTICRVRAVVALVAGLAIAALSAAAASADSGGILWSGSFTGFCPEYFPDCEILIGDIPMTLPVGYVSVSYNAISISEDISVYLKVRIYQNYEVYEFMPDLTDPQQFLSHENLSANFCASASESACVGHRGSFSVHPFPENINTAAVHMIVYNHNIPVTVQLSGIVEYGMKQSGILPALSDEYFQPYSYDRNPQSPLSNVRIDFQHVVRSTVTVLSFFSEGNYLTWIAAFAVIFILLSAFVNYFINKFRGG